MKNTKEYAQKIKKLFTALKKNAAKLKIPEFANPVDSLIFAAVCQDISEAETRAVIKKLEAHFVDKNDLRVSRSEEIVEVSGKSSPNSEKIARRLTTLLNSVFHKYDMVSLEELGLQGKRHAKEILDNLEGITEFVSSYIMMTAVDAHTIPLTETMFDYLISCKLVPANSTPAQAAGFLERQIPATNTYAFYALLRKDAESTKSTAEKLFGKESKPAKKKTVKKTVKKTAAKKTLTKTKKAVAKKTTRKKTKKK
ncbi:MAG: hypothetical protein K8R02_09120 [Anaerohalosphaeraceae bacterium]|nr:hypothetical protein [Anaerohalosphaeraceae bacterium]